MIDRRQFCSATSSALLLGPRRVLGLLSGENAPKPHLIGPGHEFVLQSPIANPFFVWPCTLLSYGFVSAERVDPTTHELRYLETGATIPFQIAAHGMPGMPAEILFFSDLPVGATRTYRLSSRASESLPTLPQRVSVATEGNAFTIDTGAIRIRIPASQSVTGEAPGPILQVGRGGSDQWVGSSTFRIAGHPIASIHTEQIEAGPLRSRHSITYALGSGLRCIATVECVAGMDFIRLHEDMESLPADAHGTFDFAWSGCTFSHRQGPNHPYNFPAKPLPDYTQYAWEAIAPQSMDTQFGVSHGISAAGKLPFSLRLFEPWSDALAASFANFWSDTTQHAAALFIDHMEQWEDHEYAIWHSSPRLAVDFVYASSILHFVYNVARGTRSTCLSFYDHAVDIVAMKTLERYTRGVERDGETFQTGIFPTSHALELQQWHGTLNLDKTKDWSLSYPREGARPGAVFKVAPWKSAADFFHTIDRSGFLTDLALSGTRQNHGFGPTSSRMLLESWVPGYQIFREEMTPDQQRRVEGVLLLLAYVHAGEDYMPMQRMLSGHPNFLSDVKSTPPGMAFLFPSHPAADTWSEEWEAFLSLNTRYHTRPAVEPWHARGGRWTENLGTYVWAFLRPASRASFLLKCRDGHERFCTPQLVMLGDWLVNALSAPFGGENPAVMQRLNDEAAHNEGSRRHNWGIVSAADAPRRVHPPVGAHAERRKTPRTMWYLGRSLMEYSPMTAEHLMWAARPTDQDMEVPLTEIDPYAVMFAEGDNHGTNPHLRTAKYTGFGITLRAAVDTPQEISIHLMQIDDGPNYRWGLASEGSCGVVYFFANGKGYSHNGGEDVGDRTDQDTDFGTNFGVWKDGAFRSVGQNVLSRPVYDLAVAQFAEVTPRSGSGSYSWPEYVSRSILLAGDDYFILHDKVFNPQVAHRFSWFVRKGDEFPNIALIHASASRDAAGFTKIDTDATVGRWYDGTGDSMVLITHKESIHAEPTPFGARVSLPGGSDLVFATQKTITFQEGTSAFTGTTGILRKRDDAIELALIHGTHIAASGLSFTTTDTALGISATISRSGEMAGLFFAPSASSVVIELPANAERLALYINGTKSQAAQQNGQLTVAVPAGNHHWELTANLPVPLAPEVEYAESTRGGAVVHGLAVASADTYILELSADNAATWREAGRASTPVFTLAGLTREKKYHVRLIARNHDRQGSPGAEYPLYISDRLPAPPSGLHVDLAAGTAHLRWGGVLGMIAYRVYRKNPGDQAFRIAYSGRSTNWDDHDPAILPPASSPEDTPSGTSGIPSAFEYYVTSVSHLGESRPSRKASTHPASWRNWNPTSGEPFRRTVERTEGAEPNDGGGHYYPV